MSYLIFFPIPVRALIDQEVKNGIPSHRIVLGGFSQVRKFKHCKKYLLDILCILNSLADLSPCCEQT